MVGPFVAAEVISCGEWQTTMLPSLRKSCVAGRFPVFWSILAGVQLEW